MGGTYLTKTDMERTLNNGWYLLDKDRPGEDSCNVNQASSRSRSRD